MATLSTLIRLVLPAVVAASLTACTATSFLSLTPARPDGPWVNGHPTSLTQHPDSVQVRVGFIRYEPTALVFETEISNYSDRPIQVAPATFYYLMLPPDTVAEKQLAKGIFESRVPALDPEVQLQQLAAKLDKQAAKATNVSWFEILTTATHIAEDVASIKKKETAEQVAERDSRHQSDDAYFEEQREQHAQQADQLYSQQQSLKATVLRKTTLEPGQRAVGQVHFPRRDYAQRLRLVVFFDERPVQFDFTQATPSRK
ncbi:hypothetical protein HNQ93_003900 [Hymenobacter luteus]|uniref:Uncharacterized protein n=2 Tax=Hymenobacter TaxID=89966 RepID=A0A7W9T5X8_9BACT|nr:MULTISPECIES: hypothetical protein [Hymenobacter]MBB4603016.1 hypothetical protein [Hymenobacter latericoloratus]MBB6061024.1 hypothetical protein [Hymenobacter luteus]